MTTTIPMLVGDTSAVPSPQLIHAPASCVRDTEAELRRACAELLLAGSLLLSDVSRAMGSYDWKNAVAGTEERFRKALEGGREALS